MAYCRLRVAELIEYSLLSDGRQPQCENSLSLPYQKTSFNTKNVPCSKWTAIICGFNDFFFGLRISLTQRTHTFVHLYRVLTDRSCCRAGRPASCPGKPEKNVPTKRIAAPAGRWEVEGKHTEEISRRRPIQKRLTPSIHDRRSAGTAT